MEGTALIGLLEQAVPGGVFETRREHRSADDRLRARPSASLEIGRALRDAPDLRFDFLAELTAVDFRRASRGSS